MVSMFRGMLEFFGRLGVYDVVLPFLLVFTIVFAILEKTKVFGMQEIEGKQYTRKNLNSMTAFVLAFLVIASTRLVAIINQAMAQMVLLLLLSICFLILIGSFLSAQEMEEGVFLEKGIWRTIFMIIMFIGISLIFLNAVGWLQPTWEWMILNWNSTAAGSVLLMVIIIVFMYVIVKEPKANKSES